MGFFKDIRVAENGRAERLVAVGALGWARIDGVHDTGLTAGDDAALIFDLTVEVPGRERYRTAHTQVVSRDAAERLKQGARVPVRVDPEDPTELLLS
ncbi:MAG: hypothetical protein WD844_08150 [Thermoleophilaceae bacterium]